MFDDGDPLTVDAYELPFELDLPLRKPVGLELILVDLPDLLDGFRFNTFRWLVSAAEVCDCGGGGGGGRGSGFVWSTTC